MFNRLEKFLTPIRFFSVAVVLGGILDHTSNPLEHFGVVGLYQTNEVTEWLIRVVFLFCGIFAFLGNGKTKRIRATIASIPIIYLGIYYLLTIFEFRIHVLVIPTLFTLLPGIWLLLFGDNYE